MKTYYKTTIALGIALAFSAGNAALAVEKEWKFNEDKWQEVISYGSVPIANESSGEWGPWSEFIQPAAGPAVPFLGQAEGDLYKPIPPVIPPTSDACPTGAACGYAIYKVKGGDGGEASSFGFHPVTYYPATFIAYPTFGDPEIWFKSEWVWVKDGKWSGHWELQPVEKGTTGTLDGNFSLAHLNGSNPSDPAPVPNASGDVSGNYYIPSNSWQAPYGNASSGDANIDGKLTNDADRQTANGEFAIYAYMNGVKVQCYSECVSRPGVEGYYIAGYPTALAYMDTARAEGMKATYYGHEILSGGHVRIKVEFGPSTWKGDWYGSWSAPAFGANGTITGANIQSTAVTTGAYGYQAQGQVQGTFYGAVAQGLAGVADVTFTPKTVPTGPEVRTVSLPEIRHVDLFATNRVAD
ncbi:MAG: hypothetical protein KJ958_14105 [Gammaproteobacteria bacterium]|nr:hypothetical protein [Gammaproteobacteria bacterium]MBU1980294.1 hypothetical protein [Gammaproteobacteria bacterium]